jgi:translation initiation factor IF-1
MLQRDHAKTIGVEIDYHPYIWKQRFATRSSWFKWSKFLKPAVEKPYNSSEIYHDLLHNVRTSAGHHLTNHTLNGSRVSKIAIMPGDQILYTYVSLHFPRASLRKHLHLSPRFGPLP